MADMPKSGRALWTAVIILVAVLGAVFASTMGGAVLFVALVAAAGYALYVIGYKGDRFLRKKEWF